MGRGVDGIQAQRLPEAGLGLVVGLELDEHLAVAGVLHEERLEPGDALLDAMLAAEVDGARLTEDEIASNAVFLFLAGHETTTNLIGNGVATVVVGKWCRQLDETKMREQLGGT
mgnify:CR=1 FL=1